MSQMPDKIWLHKDTKYSTADTVCGYQYDFVQGIEDEGGIENFVKYVPADAFIEKAEDFIRRKICDYIVHYNYGTNNDMETMYVDSRFFDDFKNYIKGE